MTRSKKWERVGYVGVDAGTVMVIDPCWLDDGTSIIAEWRDVMMEYDTAQLSPGFVVSSTGIGDGQYPVYARRDGGRIAELRIVFLGDEGPYGNADEALAFLQGVGGFVGKPE